LVGWLVTRCISVAIVVLEFASEMER